MDAALDAAESRFGDARQDVYERQGMYETDEEYADFCRGEASEVTASYEEVIREELNGEELVKALKLIDKMYDQVLIELYKETGMADYA